MSMSSASETDEPYPWERPLGARQIDDERAEFRVWAPRAAAPVVKVEGARHAMIDVGLGMWEAIVPAAPGQRLRLRDRRRGPARPCLALAAGGPARALARAGHPPPGHGAARRLQAPALEDLLIYELHIGTFTPEGTFAAAAERLAGLADLGVTAVEIMPVAEFPGARGWGYDGVYISAAQSSYGGPLELAAFVAEAHRHGLAVILDVVYNHLGASGAAAMEAFGPYFTAKYETPWGKAMNFDDADCDAVREWVCQSAEGWVRDFGIDGLRLDAIHAIFDQSPEHIVAAVARRVHAVNPRHYVIAESGLNDPIVMRPPERGGLELRRRLGRRLPPRAAHAHHRGPRRLLRRLRLRGPAGQGLSPPPRRRRRVLAVSAPPLRRAGRGRPARALRRLLPEPRPGRQPRLRGPHARHRPPAGGVLHPALAVRPDAVHGRGVRRAGAVSVLHQPHRPRHRRGDAGGAAQRVRRLRPVRRRGPRPRGPAHVRALQAHPPAPTRAWPACTGS